MKITALQALTIRDPETGALTAIGYGCVADVDDELGASLIADGLAEEYTLITPTGTVQITANGETDVAQYAKANVSVQVGTVTFVPNGASGVIDAVSVPLGSSITLPDGSALTPPSGFAFGGWATTASATEPDATSPYTVNGNVRLYAVWIDNRTKLIGLSFSGSGTLTPAFAANTLEYTLTFVSGSSEGELLASVAGGETPIALYRNGDLVTNTYEQITQTLYADSDYGVLTVEAGTGANKTVYTINVPQM